MCAKIGHDWKVSNSHALVMCFDISKELNSHDGRESSTEYERDKSNVNHVAGRE